MTETPIAVDDPGAHLRHRPPFLFVDRAEIDADGAGIRGWRTFAPGEAFFEGHFPGEPIVPGVILLEFVAQTANLLLSHRAGRPVQGYLVGVDEARFNQPVHPGRTVVAEVRPARGSPTVAGGPGIVAFRATVLLDGRRCMRTAVSIHQGG